jgi:hypothetical protein
MLRKYLNINWTAIAALLPYLGTLASRRLDVLVAGHRYQTIKQLLSLIENATGMTKIGHNGLDWRNEDLTCETKILICHKEETLQVFTSSCTNVPIRALKMEMLESRSLNPDKRKGVYFQ